MFAYTPGKAADPLKYEYRSAEVKKVSYRLPDGDGERIIAYLSDNGEFVRDPKSPADSGSIMLDAFNDPRKRWFAYNTTLIIGYDHELTEPVYEFRSGRLVPGRLVFPGLFVPTVGGIISSIDDYIPDPVLPRIYNLPGTMVKVPVGQRPQRFAATPTWKPLIRPDYPTSYPLNWQFAASPAWQPFMSTGPVKYPEITHSLTLDVERKVGVIRGDSVFIGRLDKLGQFTENRKIDPIVYQKQQSLSIQNSEGIMEIIPIINHPVIVPVPNTISDGELVYEYRSGKLTCGKLNFDGVFEPNAGTIVIDFGTFRYTKEEWRIYNLPGTFTPILKRQP